MKISNEMYDFLKKVTQVVLPAFGVLYVALATQWNLPNPEQVSATILAVVTFLGVCLGLLTTKYNNSDRPFDGEMTVQPGNDEGVVSTYQLALNNEDPTSLADKDRVVFRVNKAA